MGYPQFSIVVPVYNTEKELPKCLDSILAQTFRNFELIIVDDGSTDSSPEICEAYAMRDTRIRIVHKENGGVSSARNVGIELASGQFLWFVDSDDTIEAFALEEFDKHISKVTADIYIFNDKGNPELFSGNIEEFFWKYYVKYRPSFGPWNKIYRREIVCNNGLRFDTEEKIGEDLLFNITYYSFSFSFSFLGRKFYNYVQRENSAMHKGHSERLEQQLRLFKKIKCLLENKVSSKMISYLFLMHLFAGLNQTGKQNLNEIMLKKFAIEYDFEHALERTKEIIDVFFINENSSIWGRIRVNLFLFFLQKKHFFLACSVL